MSKLMSEKIIQDTFKAHSIPFAILRYFNVAGADPNGRTGQINLPASHLIESLVKQPATKENSCPYMVMIIILRWNMYKRLYSYNGFN